MADDPKPEYRHGDPEIIDGADVHLEPHVFEAGKASLAYALSLANTNTLMRGYVVKAADDLTQRVTPPVIRKHPTAPEIDWAGKTFKVDPDCADAFAAMLTAHPERVSLRNIIGPHPERKVRKWPRELRNLVDTNRKGSRLNF